MVGGWLMVTGVAVGVSVAAVGLVSDSMTADRPRALSASAVSAALAEARPPSTAGPVTPTTLHPTTVTGPSTTGTGPTATTRPSTATTQPTTVTTVPTTATTVPVTTAPEERTYRLVGGQARIRFTPAGATILSAAPEAGFTMEQEDHGPGDVEIRFRSDDHESRLRAWWDGGPKAEVRES